MQFNADHDAMRHYLEENLTSYLELLKKMVAINSYTGNPTGVNRLASLTAETFAELGFEAESVPSTNSSYGDHLVLTRAGSSGQKIGLVSHLDTVFPEEEEIENDFHWRLEEGRIYGPGTVDIKGGTVIIYMMLDALRQFAPEAFNSITWIILLDSSEERDGEDFGELCNERLQDGLACLIFEGGQFDGNRFRILVKRKGMTTYRVRVHGRAAHAGTAHPKGANAILQMADVIRKIEGFTNYERDITFNVGVVSGGTVSNRVPHYAEAHVEMRAYELSVFNAGVKKMLALNDFSSVSSAQDDFKCTVEVEVDRQTPPWPYNGGTQMLYQVWRSAAEQIGYEVLPQARGGLSDGNFIWQTLPTIDALGPDGANAHCSERTEDGSKDQEYATLASFVPKALLNSVAVLSLIGENLEAAAGYAD